MRVLPRRGFGPVLEIVATVFVFSLTAALIATNPPRVGSWYFYALGFWLIYGVWALMRAARGILSDWRRLDAPRRGGQTALRTITDGEEG